ncbi:hypothetical protein L6Q96_04015 [Candidatus Binatia bacterium]|nr:hypothetical protein [Candidatus Binatia bacterium]
MIARLGSSILLFLAAASVAFVLWRIAGVGPAAPAATPTPSPPAGTPTPTVTPLQAPKGYRLAGVAVGDAESYAVIEAPTGSSVLYRLNATVPGLGRLVRIEPERVVLAATDTDQFELWIAPAPSPTPGRIPASRALTPERGGRPRLDRRTPGSTP